MNSLLGYLVGLVCGGAAGFMAGHYRGYMDSWSDRFDHAQIEKDVCPPSQGNQHD